MKFVFKEYETEWTKYEGREFHKNGRTTYEKKEYLETVDT